MSNHELGTALRIDDRTVLVLGQELDVAANQPDVANVLLHRVDQTLFMIDTGVTIDFRAAVRTAVDLVGPWDRLVVLIKNGHPDHVGNNDLADELAAERGIPAELLVPAADLNLMRDPQAYWKTSFDRLTGLAPLPAAPGLAALKITSLFQPYRPFSHHTRTYEQTAPEAITIGTRRFVGWTYADGACSAAKVTAPDTSSSTSATTSCSISAMRWTVPAPSCTTPTSTSSPKSRPQRSP